MSHGADYEPKCLECDVDINNSAQYSPYCEACDADLLAVRMLRITNARHQLKALGIEAKYDHQIEEFLRSDFGPKLLAIKSK
jgi:hypothetical protein